MDFMRDVVMSKIYYESSLYLSVSLYMYTLLESKLVTPRFFSFLSISHDVPDYISLTLFETAVFGE